MKKGVFRFAIIISLIFKIASTALAASQVVINEVMPSNHTTAADQNGEYDDWIELYNNSVSSFDLSGCYLTDNSGKLTKWKFPLNTVITGNGYLIIWADKDTLQSGLHANFKLSASGEKVYLVAPDVSVIDHIKFGAADSTKELTYSRVPNGTGDFVWQTPTFGKSNNLLSSKTVKKANSFTLYPNPAKSSLLITDNSSDKIQQLVIYNLVGTKVYTKMMNLNATITVSTWKNGIYFVAINGLTIGKVLVNH